jgi:excisionase family DNA binding protein
MNEPTKDELMSVADVIQEMGISRSTWQKLVAQKATPAIVRIGKVQRIRREALSVWLQSQES